MVIEYSDLPKDLAEERDENNELRFKAGSIAVHCLSVNFVHRLTDSSSPVSLPWHRAEKKVRAVDPDTGRTIEPDEPNAIKFERFIFDALPEARRTLVMEVRREDEYDPLKNAEGEHSPESVKASLSALYVHWLRDAGVRMPQHDLPPIEISPLYALDPRELAEKVENNLRIDGPLYLEEHSP